MSIFILGDIHGNLKPIKRWCKDFSMPGDTIIQVGDFGCGFLHYKAIKAVADRLDKKECKMLVVRGNHDNPCKFNCSIGPITFLQSNCVREVEGNKILFMGGAISIDRSVRTVDEDWWPGEGYQHDIEFLKQVKDIDTVITHAAPLRAAPFFKPIFIKEDSLLQEDLQREKDTLEEAYNILSENNNITNWYFGHYHISYFADIGNTKFTCLDINEIKQHR